MNTKQMIEELAQELRAKYKLKDNTIYCQDDIEFVHEVKKILTKHEAAVLEREAKWCLDQKLPEVAEVPALYYPNNMKLVTVNKERNATLQSTADHLRKQQN